MERIAIRISLESCLSQTFNSWIMCALIFFLFFVHWFVSLSFLESKCIKKFWIIDFLFVEPEFRVIDRRHRHHIMKRTMWIKLNCLLFRINFSKKNLKSYVMQCTSMVDKYFHLLTQTEQISLFGRMTIFIVAFISKHR